MCIIAAKPAGVQMPHPETLARMWYANRDGAGFMYAADGKVVIEKGFMRLADFESAIERVRKAHDMTKLAIVFHFRITTHGGTKPSNCHPFPLTRSISKLQALKAYSNIGVAHNGIIPIRPRNGISDTMEYIATRLAPLSACCPDFLHEPAALELIENGIQSKMAFLTDSGEIVTIGQFIEDGGVWYSNGSYKGYGRQTTVWHSSQAKSKSKPEAKTKAGKTTSKSKRPAQPAKKPLQWAVSLPNGSFAMNHDYNEIIDDLTDLLIDEDGKAYVYDYERDAALRLGNTRLYNAEGFKADFEPDMAGLEYVIDDETDMPFRF